MFGIGDFANLGRVSIRMLRHYDTIGLLRPARVDPGTGYRFYAATQLRLLNRVVALKDLGFSLHEVQTMIDEKLDPAELRGMLRLRQAQLTAQVADDTARLAAVDARLRMIENEGHMDTGDVILKSIPAVRVAQLSAPSASYDGPDIGPALSPLYPVLIERMEKAGLRMTGAPLAHYLPQSDDPADESIFVHAAFPYAGEPPPDPGFTVTDLPAVEHAATLLHHGSMNEAFRTGQMLANWIDENGYHVVDRGYAREIYLECPPGEYDQWVTEMQVEVRPPGRVS